MLYLPTNIICGYFHSSEKFGTISHSPAREVETFEIEFYQADGGMTYCDGNAYRIQKDHIQIAKPGQIRHTALPFSTLFLKFEATGDLAERLTNAEEYFYCNHAEKVRKLLGDIVFVLEQGENKPLRLYSKLFAALDIILNDSVIPPLQEATAETVRTAKRFIEAHAGEPITLEDIAASVNLSKTYFHSLFTGTVGQTPHDYLIARRITNAKKMLWDSSNSIGFIAETCGFGCQQYFNKIFKQQTGMTPGQYRKSIGENYLL